MHHIMILLETRAIILNDCSYAGHNERGGRSRSDSRTSVVVLRTVRSTSTSVVVVNNY